MSKGDRRAGRSHIVAVIAATVCLGATLLVVYILSTGGDVTRLRKLLGSYLAEEEPASFGLERDNRMILLIRRIEPLDSRDKINAVLDICLYFDATDNRASGFARESLLKHAEAALPVCRERLATVEDSTELDALIAELEAKLPEEPDDETIQETDEDEGQSGDEAEDGG